MSFGCLEKWNEGAADLGSSSHVLIFMTHTRLENSHNDTAASAVPSRGLHRKQWDKNIFKHSGVSKTRGKFPAGVRHCPPASFLQVVTCIDHLRWHHVMVLVVGCWYLPHFTGGEELLLSCILLLSRIRGAFPYPTIWMPCILVTGRYSWMSFIVAAPSAAGEV